MIEPTISQLTIPDSAKADAERPAVKNVTPPEWIELLPAGQFKGRDGRGPFKLDDPQGVIRATLALQMKAGIPIDYDHATDLAAPQGRPAPAAGWIKELQVRSGAIWGKVEWTRHGAAAVATREYRYVSPVFEYSNDGEVMRLLRAALTNNPNLYMTAISARAPLSMPIGKSDAKPSGEENEMETLLAQLREILGLDESAGAEEALEAIRTLQAAAAHDDDDNDDGNEGAAGDDDDAIAPHAPANSGAHAGDADPARYVPISQFQSTLTELNSLRAARARERAEHAVNEAMRAGKLIPAQREWAIAYCQADYKGFTKFIARQPALFAANSSFDGEPPASAIRAGHFDDDSIRGASAGGSLTQTERAICANLNVKANDFLRHKTRPGYFLSH